MNISLKKTLVGIVGGFALCGMVAESAGAATSVQKGQTVVLVHGAWANGSSWNKVIAQLQRQGFNVVAVHDPMNTFADDVATVTRAIEAQTEPVILVGHSYGGAIITEAGNNPKVAALVYVAAYAPSEGESVTAINKTFPPQDWWNQIKADSAGFLTLAAPAVLSRFAADLPAAEASVMASNQGPTNAKCFDAVITKAAWKSKPTWYVVAGNDQILPPAYEAASAKKLGAVATTIANSSHVAMVSHPIEVAAVITAAAEKVAAR